MSDIQSEYKLFLKQLIILTLVIFLLAWGISYFFEGRLSLGIIAVLILFFSIMSAGLHKVLLNVSVKRPQQFVNTFMGLTGGKLFVLFTVIIIMLALAKDQLPKTSLIIHFFALYISFTTFEISHLLKAMNRVNKK